MALGVPSQTCRQSLLVSLGFGSGISIDVGVGVCFCVGGSSNSRVAHDTMDKSDAIITTFLIYIIR